LPVPGLLSSANGVDGRAGRKVADVDQGAGTIFSSVITTLFYSYVHI